jgi:hypothetical protein
MAITAIALKIAEIGEDNLESIEIGLIDQSSIE